MSLFARLLQLSCAFWITWELMLVLRRRAGPGAQRRDGGSLVVLNVVIYAAIGVGLFYGLSGRLAYPIPRALHWPGLALLLAGLALRMWAVRTLREFFTVDVAIQEGHQLVRTGPYRLLRHPAYTGVLASFAGLGLCSGSWISAVIIFVPICGAFLYRIAVEERALRAAFPEAYPAYAAATARLVPWIY
jgi:protein-S-isoprenylcysteine O-methyltransferase